LDKITDWTDISNFPRVLRTVVTALQLIWDAKFGRCPTYFFPGFPTVHLNHQTERCNDACNSRSSPYATPPPLDGVARRQNFRLFVRPMRHLSIVYKVGTPRRVFKVKSNAIKYIAEVVCDENFFDFNGLAVRVVINRVSIILRCDTRFGKSLKGRKAETLGLTALNRSG